MVAQGHSFDAIATKLKSKTEAQCREKASEIKKNQEKDLESFVNRLKAKEKEKQ